MEKNNLKIVKLLKEGISFETIKKLNKDQISALYKRFVNEATTTTSTKYNLKDKKDLDAFMSNTNKKPENTTFNPDDDTAMVAAEGELEEKSVSRKQQKAMGLALAAKKGDVPKSKLKGASKEMVKMSEKDLEDFASTKHKGLPEKKKKENKEGDDVKKLEESILKLVQKHIPPTLTKSELIKLISKK